MKVTDGRSGANPHSPPASRFPARHGDPAGVEGGGWTRGRGDAAGSRFAGRESDEGADRRIYTGDEYAADEFEMLTLSLYQKLNEERAGIGKAVMAGGRLHQV